MVSGGYHDYDSDRIVQLGATRRTASSSPSGLEFSATAGAGYDFEIGGLKIGPTASIQYSHLSIDSYTESGAGALDLNVDSQTADSLLAAVGLRVRTLIELPKLRIIPEVRASFQHDFEDQERTITARFASGGGGQFGFNTRDIGQDSTLIGAGVTFLDDKNWSSFIDFTAEIGRKDYAVHRIRGGFRISF